MADELHDALNQHAASLRLLARDLLRDAHAADDVTQAALQQALVHRPARPESLGGWLATTLVNCVRQLRRSERRRLAREQALPHRSHEPAVAESLVRREMLRAVTEAVLALDEPYQTTVFLRYFENLPPRAIARHTGTNVATVKSRLARGLQLLRGRLDAGKPEGRSWRPALALAFGVPLTPVLLLPTGALLMTATPKVLLAAGVLCVGSLWFWQGDDVAVVPHAEASDSADARAAVADSRVDANADASGQREPAAPTTAANEAWLAHPFALELELHVVDELGLPKAGHRPRISLVGMPMIDAPEATDGNGRVLLRWNARSPRMVIDIEEPLGGMRRRVVVQHGTRARLAMLGQTMRDEHGLRLTFTKSDVDLWAAQGAARMDTLLFTEALGVRDHASGATKLAVPLHPHELFHAECLGVITPPKPTEAVSENLLADVFFAREQFARSIAMTAHLGDNRKVFLDAGSEPERAPRASLTGTVFDERGAPAARTAVVLLGDGPQPVVHTHTGDDGSFTFDDVAPGTWTVRAGGDRLGLATTTAAVTTGVTPSTLHLRTGACIRGRARTADGQAMAHARLEWRAADGAAIDATHTDDAGSFVFANLPGGPGMVMLYPDDERRLPIAIAPNVLPDSGELLLQPKGPGSTLRAEPVLAGTPADGDDGERILRVLQVESGLTMRLQPKGDAETAFVAERLPPGAYELELHHATAGLRSLGTQWLDGQSIADLGRVETARGGEVEFTPCEACLPAEAGARQFALCELRTDADLRGDTLTSLADPLRLPAGNWALGYRGRDGGARFVRFTVRAGARTTVALRP